MKKVVMTIVLAVSVVLLFGCSSTITNEDAGEKVKEALEARWAYQSEMDTLTTDNAGKLYVETTDKELEKVSDLKDADFEDKDMEKAVKEYISVLEKEKELCSKYDGDFWTQEYNYLVYQKQRQKLIKEIIEKSDVELTGDTKENYEELIDENQYKDMKEGAKIVDEAFTILKTKVEDSGWDDGTCKVSSKVKNNTDYSFPQYALIFREKAKDGTTIESKQYVYIENFEAGATAWTDGSYSMKKGHTVEIYAYIVGLEKGTIDYEVELKKPIVVKIK